MTDRPPAVSGQTPAKIRTQAEWSNNGGPLPASPRDWCARSHVSHLWYGGLHAASLSSLAVGAGALARGVV